MSESVTEQRTLKADVAEELRALLGRRRMTTVALARAIGKSHTYVWRRLNGETAFDLDDIENIAATLGISPIDLLQAAAGLTTIRYDSDRDLWGHRPNVRQAVDRPRNRTDGRSPIGRRAHRTNQSVRP